MLFIYLLSVPTSHPILFSHNLLSWVLLSAWCLKTSSLVHPTKILSSAYPHRGLVPSVSGAITYSPVSIYLVLTLSSYLVFFSSEIYHCYKGRKLLSRKVNCLHPQENLITNRRLQVESNLNLKFTNSVL